jgi:hypothetical protein
MEIQGMNLQIINKSTNISPTIFHGFNPQDQTYYVLSRFFIHKSSKDLTKTQKYYNGRVAA